jgi:transposase InsO family protein
LFGYYPNAGTTHKKAENLLNREFEQQTLNTHWVGDITYIKTYQGWSYLASVLDLSSKQVVGWALYCGLTLSKDIYQIWLLRIMKKLWI